VIGNFNLMAGNWVTVGHALKPQPHIEHYPRDPGKYYWYCRNCLDSDVVDGWATAQRQGVAHARTTGHWIPRVERRQLAA